MTKHFMKIFRRYRKSERGIAAVEFALVSPILFLLLLGGVEVGRYILVHQKVEKMAYSVSDVVSQLEADADERNNAALLRSAERTDLLKNARMAVFPDCHCHTPVGQPGARVSAPRRGRNIADL